MVFHSPETSLDNFLSNSVRTLAGALNRDRKKGRENNSDPTAVGAFLWIPNSFQGKEQRCATFSIVLACSALASQAALSRCGAAV